MWRFAPTGVLQSLALCLCAIVFLTACHGAKNDPQDGLKRGVKADDRLVFPFNPETFEEWQQRRFKGNTTYSIVKLNNEQVLEASTDSTASLLFRQQRISLVEKPVVRWRWRIQDVFKASHDGQSLASERSEAGDDYPARFYVAVQTGLSPWETLAINYVWSSSEPVGASWDNAFSDKAKMLVLQSGDEKKLQWVSETRNLREDFKKLHGLDADAISGFAVMVDGDNSGQSGTAWFGDIEFLSEP